MRWTTGGVALAVAYIAVHLLLWWGNLVKIDGTASSDTHVYLAWMEAWRSTGRLVGIDLPWVYPVGALPPMQFAFLFGPAGFLTAWVALITVLDAGALVLVARRSMSAAWWWLGCMLLLGPVSVSHLDGVALPFAVMGVLAIRRHPAVASSLFVLGAWIKVWPAALLAALVVAGRRRVAVALAAVGTSAVVVGLAVAAGARRTLLSFIGDQATRGLQIEAPAASPFLLRGSLGGPERIVYDHRILTFQVHAAHAATVARLMTPVLLVGVVALVTLALVALRRGRDRDEVLALTALGLVAALIALNKVGSPQYYDWFVAPVLLGLLTTRRFRTPAVIVLITSGLTFLIYPVGYDAILHLQLGMIAVLALRNAAVLVLLGWALWRLARRGRRIPAVNLPPQADGTAPPALDLEGNGR